MNKGSRETGNKEDDPFQSDLRRAVEVWRVEDEMSTVCGQKSGEIGMQFVLGESDIFGREGDI